MLVQVQRSGNELHVRIDHSRIEGENFLLAALRDGHHIVPEITLVVLDLDRVEYLNSLGITEFVNVHRLFSEATHGAARFRFINVEKKIKGILELVELDKIADIQPKQN